MHTVDYYKEFEVDDTSSTSSFKQDFKVAVTKDSGGV